MSGQSGFTAASLWARIRSGPTRGATSEDGWKWYELLWCVALVGWFGTAGRPLDIILAVGIVLVWIFGPSVGPFVAGHLVLVGRGLVPTLWWAWVITELLLVAPLLFELIRAVFDRRWRRETAALVGITLGSVLVGILEEWTALELGATAVGSFVLALLWFRYRSLAGDAGENTQLGDAPK